MKILIAPNAMKGSLSAFEFADAIAEGLSKSGLHNTIKLPVADGGDGTASILAKFKHAKLIKCKATDPLYRPIETGFYINEKHEAFIEMADISGIKLLHRHEYSPLKTTSFGFGELIKIALQYGAKTLFLCIGGSATVDAGMGALMALGTIFYHQTDQISHGCGENLQKISYIDTSVTQLLLNNIQLIFIVDVENPLLGQLGAATVFAPQKGATPSQVQELETGLTKYANILQKQTNIDVTKVKGSGAAGGIAASFKALFEANIENGAEYVLKRVGFYKLAKQVNFIITGEGCIDQSTLYGKATGAILNFGTEIDIPVFGICGTNHLKPTNRFEQIFAISLSDHDKENAMNNAYTKVVNQAAELGTYIKKELMNNSINEAKLAFENDETDKCLHIVDSILTNNNNTDALLLKARVLYKKQQWGETLNALNAILAVEPENEMAINYKNMATNILSFWHKDNYNP